MLSRRRCRSRISSLKRPSFEALFAFVWILRDPAASSNPEILLKEANRLAWLFNWPKAEPLYIRAEQLFKCKGDTRNEVYSRVGRIRAQSETMSWVDVSEILGKELDLPIAKSDQKLRLWCLAAKGQRDTRTWRSIRYRPSVCGRKLKESPMP